MCVVYIDNVDVFDMSKVVFNGNYFLFVFLFHWSAQQCMYTTIPQPSQSPYLAPCWAVPTIQTLAFSQWLPPLPPTRTCPPRPFLLQGQGHSSPPIRQARQPMQAWCCPRTPSMCKMRVLNQPRPRSHRTSPRIPWWQRMAPSCSRMGRQFTPLCPHPTRPTGRGEICKEVHVTHKSLSLPSFRIQFEV